MRIVTALLLGIQVLMCLEAQASPKEDLIQAINRGRSDLVQVAIEQGARVNQLIQIQGMSLTPLDWAAKNGNAKLIRFLLDKGADPNLQSSQKFPPLAWALAYGNDIDSVKILLEHGANLHYVYPDDGTTMLMTACMSGNVPIVKYLQSKGLDLHQGNFEDYNCLMVAAHYGHFHLLRYLLKQGMQLEQSDRQGRRVLTEAIYGRHNDIVKYYLAHAKDPQAFAKAIDYASLYQRDMLSDLENWKNELQTLNQALIEALKAQNRPLALKLLTQGANPNASSPEDLTALDIVETQGDLELFQALHQAGADISQVNEVERSYLIHAARDGHLELVKYLLKQGLDINARSLFDSNALLEAAIGEHTETVQFLLASGAQTQDAKGVSVLMKAADLGQLQAVKLLVACGMNPAQKDHQGKSALDYAIAANEADIIGYLQSLSAAHP